MRSLKMYWWNEQPNFGDALNPIIIQRLFGISVQWSPLETAELVGAGSCLQWVAKSVRKNPHEIHIWGTGYIFDKEPAVDSSLVVQHAVRGQKSRDYGKLDDAVTLGDPGILASLLIPRPSSQYRIGIVPHLWNMKDKELAHLYNDPTILIIDVTKSPLKVIEEIASCEFIFSSSLHGLIIADSFGIPNQWVTFDIIPFGGDWKFNDYYSLYGPTAPTPIKFSKSLTNKNNLQELSNHTISSSIISKTQQNLLDVFPFSP